jgi:SAM-dependent methyltransferase
MGKIEWGLQPELFGPRHAHRERRIVKALHRVAPGPGLHLECAAGVGSLSSALAHQGKTVVAADLSMRSLAVIRKQVARSGSQNTVLPVVADVTCLPFSDQKFATVSSAETLEHIADDRQAAAELARVVKPGGWLAGTVPSEVGDWQEWDEWAGHVRRYTAATLNDLLTKVGLEARVISWGWPLLRLYDALFLYRVNRRRLRTEGPTQQDPALRAVASLGRQRWLVRLVRAVLDLDHLFDGVSWGVGLLFMARKPESGEEENGEHRSG